MKAAVVTEPGKAPTYANFAEPVAKEGDRFVTVTAAALSHLARGRASGTHYSSRSTFPFVAGVDGTGVLDNGTRVYFFSPEAPYGSMAERSLVKAANCITLPDQLDDVTAAAIAIPGMSSWAALTERARLAKGETVLINGATGNSGRLAVQIAKYLGAGKVVATGRNAEVLRSLPSIGADVTVALTQDPSTLENQFQELFAEGIGVVLDYVWGTSAESILAAAARSAPEAVPIRFVQIGSMAASSITLPSAVLRSSSIELLGSGIGSIPMPRLVNSLERVLTAAIPGGFDIAATAVPLANLSDYWSNDASTNRVVFLPRAPS